MNLLLFERSELGADGTLVIRDQRLAHLREIHRAQAGDSLRVGEIGGLLGRAQLASITAQCAQLVVALEEQPPAKLPLCLVLALPRPKMLRRVLRMVAEFGVAELHLVNSYRVEKSYWQTPVLGERVVRQYFLQGLEQSRDTRLPALYRHRRFRPFVEDSLPGMLAGRQALLAHPGAEAACPRGTARETVLVVGPEGGFIPWEVEQLQAAGCLPVALGPRILRVENAVAALLGRLY